MTLHKRKTFIVIEVYFKLEIISHFIWAYIVCNNVDCRYLMLELVPKQCAPAKNDAARA